MEEFRLRSSRYCPFLLPSLGKSGGGLVRQQPSGRLPSGQVRAIRAQDFQRLCVEWRYYGCPGYRFWRGGAPTLRVT